MNIDVLLIEQLLYEEEGPTLDFKTKEYAFSQATEDGKGEILKDILSFANGWRRSDAFIILGVKEVPGGKCIVTGISEIYDDAHLQQFVNQKTQRHVNFSYKAVQYEEKHVGVIHIPIQERPIYLKRDFGKVKKDFVYVRRGSSTAIADPDEISKMRLFDQKIEVVLPEFQFSFLDTGKNEILGQSISLQVTDSIYPDEELPDYGAEYQSVGNGLCLRMDSGLKNKDYFRELANYYQKMFQVKKIDFCMKNISEVIGQDVKVEIIVKDPENQIILFDEYDEPQMPKEDRFSLFDTPKGNLDTIVDEIKEGYKIDIDFGKIQPKKNVCAKGSLFVGAKSNQSIELVAYIFSDNLPNPIQQKLAIEIKVDKNEILLERILKEKYGM